MPQSREIPRFQGKQLECILGTICVLHKCVQVCTCLHVYVCSESKFVWVVVARVYIRIPKHIDVCISCINVHAYGIYIYVVMHVCIRFVCANVFVCVCVCVHVVCMYKCMCMNVN